MLPLQSEDNDNDDSEPIETFAHFLIEENEKESDVYEEAEGENASKPEFSLVVEERPGEMMQEPLK